MSTKITSSTDVRLTVTAEQQGDSWVVSIPVLNIACAAPTEEQALRDVRKLLEETDRQAAK